VFFRFEVEFQGGSGPTFGTIVQADRAAVELDDLTHNGQTQSGALAGRLGREEWLEDFVEVIGHDAGAGVFHFDDDLCGPASVRACQGWGKGCAHRKRTAVGHGLGGVGEQVHEDVLHPGSIERHRREVALQLAHDIDPLLE